MKKQFCLGLPLAGLAASALARGADQPKSGNKDGPEKPASKDGAKSKPAEKGEKGEKENDPKAKEEDSEIPLSEVPAAVRKAAEAAAPKVKFGSAYRDEEDGKTSYELSGEDDQEREVTVAVTSDGKVEHVETEIALDDVPEVVQAALKTKYPKFVPSTVYEIKQEDKVAAYQFEGKRPKDKEEIAIFVSPDGKETDIDES